MAGYLDGKVVVVFGAGGDEHRGVVVALAQAGADIAIAGRAANLAAEAALHSIANEVWAVGRRSSVIKVDDDSATSFAAALNDVAATLGRADLVVRCQPVLQA